MSLNNFTEASVAESRLLTARETAKMLGISQRTLWQLMHDGELPSVRIGRSVRYDVADIRKFIDRKRQT